MTQRYRMSGKEILFYVIGGYIVVSLLFHAYNSSHLSKMYEESKQDRHKLEALHRKVDELGWATKEGIRQTQRVNAQHQLAEHTGLTAI